MAAPGEVSAEMEVRQADAAAFEPRCKVASASMCHFPGELDVTLKLVGEAALLHFGGRVRRDQYQGVFPVNALDQLANEYADAAAIANWVFQRERESAASLTHETSLRR